MGEAILKFIQTTGFASLQWQQVVMIFISCVLLYLAIKKGFEPLLLVPIAFGMLLTNLPEAGLFAKQTIDPVTGHINPGGLLRYFYYGDELGIFPPIIFMGVGAMTDFGPLIANPKSLLLGAAAQFGIFTTFLGAILLGFTGQQAGAIGIIGGADGPTAIFLASKLAPEILGAIAVAAYSYMALVPIIQPPIMKALTTKEERVVKMEQLRNVSKIEKILFPIMVTLVVSLMLPPAATLVGMLMLGNLFKESGVVGRLTDTATNALMNIVTIFLGLSVGASAEASKFLQPETIKIIVLGVLAFGVGTAAGVILGKIMYKLSGGKVNPLIGSAGVSAVPMAARVSQVVGQKENPSNFLLMHAMGPNVSGVIGSAVSAGVLLSLFG
ncbi:sodium ion-translocating decarboxylase subunit beta [Maledivibacter halophilus]|uniref:Glutaconyl-CoA decarboxylase beta subunit n=1 Tax=Maledivibacter halophilus TaxID=36842 RepID=A0A1T5MYG4_9FIRM|nr:sodium ion-translocating decarboxylase subunit beta [Maledivibacter halophilus]SKC92878.1 glutaconyl-CoA decarboxylase beta subunit [Maledivibacter halophilus]